MLGNRELALDTFCEVYDLLKPWRDFEFWDFSKHTPVQSGIYLIGREQFRNNVKLIRELAESGYCHIILSNPAEGSETLRGQCRRLGIIDLIESGRIQLIGGGDMGPNLPCLAYDSFLPKILDYDQNIQAIAHADAIYTQTNKPYKFLFLNGRYRPHRKYLLEHFAQTNLIDHAIWSNLDTGNGPIQYLTAEYEINDYADNIAQSTQSFVKHDLFNHAWGDVYLKATPYVDTYFSLVTETVFDYPYSFRTEKIWKPIAMGHPFIAVANVGYYRDLHNLGFKTFGHVIDESFDLIAHGPDRLKRIAQVVEDLCQQDLASFLSACYNVCKYNQQHLAEMRLRVRKEFPNRFTQFIQQHINE